MCADIVDGNGNLHYTYGTTEYNISRAVRPALHLNLSSNVWSYAGTVSCDGGAINADAADLQLLYDHFYRYSQKEMTDDSWVAFQAALEDAGKVLNNEQATTEEFEKATVALEKAHDNLVPAFWSFKNRDTHRASV